MKWLTDYRYGFIVGFAFGCLAMFAYVETFA
jgi:hypothetical protein